MTVPLATLGRRPAPGGAAAKDGREPPPPPALQQRPRVIFVFAEHCREVITSEVGLWLGRLLADANGHVRSWPELHAALERAGETLANAANGGSSSKGSSGGGGGGGGATWPEVIGSWADDLLSRLTIEIVPIESLDGRRRVEGGDLCLRKTPDTGVDLNRNWPFAWQRAVRF